MVIKGVTRCRIFDPVGRLYSHRHPEGWWMPGGASNTGADWIARDYAGQDLVRLDDAARGAIPTPWISYPLVGEGERFPFVAPHARGFEPNGLGELERYTARLEGVAYLERLAYEMLEDLSGEQVDRVSSAGGGSRSDTWMTIRANVLGKPVVRMRHADAAVGAAILAASTTIFDGLGDAAAAMTRLDHEVEPGALVDAYQVGYERMIAALTQRGYLAAAARSV
jgi:sugar (pentulose or hexulose) kinase